jgi:saccharopine dehydrogenase-like NADP-dependent oxidoreductase
MKNVLILGAGLVTRPIVRYLLDQPDYHVTVASRTVEKAQKLINGHPQGEAKQLLVDDTASLRQLISEADLAVSLVPYAYHPVVAEICIELGKQMVTTSYVSDAMKKLDEKAKNAGILILNEIGVDPGIDHMSAMRIIHNIKNRGGEIVSFYSYCGGLPAPEANTNPFGYKFSWSPRGVVLAGRNSGQYLKDGQVVQVESKDLFSHHWDVEVEGLGTLQSYPNRNSLPYIDLYGLQGISTMFRGTLRNPGWCDTWKKMVDMGLLDLEERNDLSGKTYRDLTALLIGANSDESLENNLAEHLALSPDSEIIQRLKWLGLLEEDALPDGDKTPLDILSTRLLEKLKYKEGERDMIVLHHDFLAAYPGENKKEKITSTLIDFGIPGGDSSMARTVSLPAAMATRLILEGKIQARGVHIPVIPEIYDPVLNELETMNIVCEEKISPVE